MQQVGCEYYPQELGTMRVVRDAAEVEGICRFLAQAPVRVFDTETSGLEWWGNSRAVGVGLGAWVGPTLRTWYFPFRHRTGEPQLPESVVVPAVRDVLAAPGTVVGHNLKFDEHIGRREGWKISGRRYDTMPTAALFDENHALELESRAQLHLGVQDPWEWKRKVHAEIAGRCKALGTGQKVYLRAHGYEEVPVNCLGIYCCHDIFHAGGLYSFFEGQIGMSRVFARIHATEMELVRILGDVEAEGLPVDADYLRNLSATLGETIDSLRARWRELVGPSVDPASDDDVRHLVYDVYKAPPGRLTKKSNKLSVEADVLEGFRDLVPCLSVLIPLRTAAKIRETYCEGILDKLDSRGYVHPSFWQSGTNTGRLSCSEPNFQNMPVEDKDRAKEHGGVDPWSIRRAFVVRDSTWPRFYFDYSQIELRVLARYSADPIMVDVYRTGGDIHDRTQAEVSEMLGRPIERRLAKIVNFGLSYCLTASGLQRQAGLSRPDADAFMGAFFSRYAGIAQFREALWAQIRSHPQSTVVNLWGRARRIPHIKSRDKWERLRAERQAIGSLIQGTAAELTKESLVRIDALKQKGYPLRVVNTVHDEIQIDIEAKHLAETVSAIKVEMERYPELDPIPVIVEAEWTVENWARKQKVIKEAA